MPIPVFLSVGRAANPEQLAFVAALRVFLHSQDLAPRTVERVDYTHRKPLQHIAKVMQASSGTIVVALERVYIAQGEELRGGVSAFNLNDVKLTMVWNQIEAAIAYTLGHPLLAIVESGLHNEGLLEEGYDWYVRWLSLDPGSLEEPAFLTTFADWKRNVEKYQAEREVH